MTTTAKRAQDDSLVVECPLCEGGRLVRGGGPCIDCAGTEQIKGLPIERFDALCNRLDRAEKLLRANRDAALSAQAAVGDRLLAKGPLSREYAASANRALKAIECAVDAFITEDT